MDCDEAILRIYQYLDGELTVWRRRAISRHLDECPPCASVAVNVALYVPARWYV